MKTYVINLIRVYVIHIIYIWIVNYFSGVKCDASFTETTDGIKAIKDKILRDYDKTLRPIVDDNATQIFASFIPRQIIDVDEEKGLLYLDFLLWLSWVDVRLSWSTEDYSQNIPLPKDMIWLPDITVINSHNVSVDPSFVAPVSIYPYGYVYWLPTILTATECSTTTQTTYPYDELECEIVFGSRALNNGDISFSHTGSLFLENFRNIHPRWELITSRVIVDRMTQYVKFHEDPFIHLRATLPLKRRPLSETEATRTPCILIITLTLSVFWLPAGSHTKCLLTSFIFVGISILVTYMASRTKNPLAILLGVSFLQSTMYVGVITFFLQMFIVIKVASWVGPARPPSLIINSLTGPMGKYFLLRSPFSDDKLELDRVRLHEDFTTTAEFSIKDEWILLATFLDRTFFLIMLSVTLAMHHL